MLCCSLNNVNYSSWNRNSPPLLPAPHSFAPGFCVPTGLGLCCPSAGVPPRQGPRRLPETLHGKNNRFDYFMD